MDNKPTATDPTDQIDAAPRPFSVFRRWLARSLAHSDSHRVLRIVGSAVMLLFVLVGAVRLAVGTGAIAFAGAREIGEFGLFLAGGFACGGLLVGISALLGAIRDLHASMIRVEKFQYEIQAGAHPDSKPVQPPFKPADPAASVPGSSAETRLAAAQVTASHIPEMTRLLEELRDNALLSDDERMEKRLQLIEEEISSAQAAVQDLISRREFTQARDLADRVRRKLPSDPRAARLVEQVASSRELAQARDIETTTKEIGDLISISAWQRARDVAMQLQQRQPDASEARRLLVRIESEFRNFQAEQRRRMHAEVQRFVSRRRWEEALAATRAFLERFPGSEEAGALALQTPTLEDNAQIERRQRLEARIMDLVRHGRYLEAVSLARDVIEKYPDSPQADALRGQLPRLEELAHDPAAAPAKVRIDE